MEAGVNGEGPQRNGTLKQKDRAKGKMSERSRCGGWGD